VKDENPSYFDYFLKLKLPF